MRERGEATHVCLVAHEQTAPIADGPVTCDGDDGIHGDPTPFLPRRHQLTLDGDGDVFDLRTVRIVLNNEVVGREVIEVRDLGVE